MKKLILIGMIIACAQVRAQTDEKRMDRDLEVAKNILGTLISGDNDMAFFNNRDIEASYLPGYGVTFTLPENPMFWSVGVANTGRMMIRKPGKFEYKYNIHMDNPDSEETPDAVIIEVPDQEENNNDSDLKVKQKSNDMDQKDYKEKQKSMQAGQDEMKDEQKSMQNDQEHLKEAIVTFFADYANLISQLGPENRIRVIEKMSPDFGMITWVSEDESGNIEQNQTGFSAEVYKKDITAYKEGKIKIDDFRKKVIFEDAKKPTRSADLDIFAKILRGYFNPDVTQSYFIEGNPTYERISNYGVIYNLRAFSSYQDNDEFRFPSNGDKKYNLEERNKKVEQMYPSFESDIKNFIVDYGRTIRSLGENEILMLKIKLTKCEGCSIPKSIDISVKGSVLVQYDQQKINREKALASIEIKKNN